MSLQRNLTIDIGNTSAKVLVFEMDAICYRKCVQSISVKDILTLLKRFKPHAAIISAVAPVSKALLKMLNDYTSLTVLNYTVKVPVKIRYRTPETLGPDRLAGIVGAGKLFPTTNVLVIDLGTCIKYDFLHKTNVYKGGSISPGLAMRFLALNQYTSKLPLIRPSHMKSFIGTDTRTSILSGVQTGVVAELDGFISRYRKEFGALKVILTGGDAPRFAGQVKMPIFAAPDLVNIGLNEILNFNARK